MKTKSISLEEAKKLPITSLYMAIICFPASQQSLLFSDETITSEAIEKINKLVDESVESLAADVPVVYRYAHDVKQALYSAITISYTTVLARTDGIWIDVGDCGCDIEKGTISHIEPLNEYCKEGEYNFKEVNGRAVLCLDSIDPLKKFESKNLSLVTM